MRRKDYHGVPGKRFTLPSKTEKYGYIPAKKRIENLITAGKNLQAYNAGLYMYNAHSMDNFSSADAVAASQPYYNDELSLLQQKAYLSGLRKARAEADARSKANAEELKKNEERFNKIVSMFEAKGGASAKPDNENKSDA